MDLLKLQYLDGFVSYKHTAFCLHKMVIDGLESCGLLWIIVMLLSAVWALILTAPIHCRWFLGEHVMQCYIYPNLLWWRIYNMDDLRVSKICADFHICVKYSLNQYADSSGELGDAAHQSPFQGKSVHSAAIFATHPGSSDKAKSYLNEWENPEISKTAHWTRD